MAVALSLLMGANSGAWAETRVVFTVDVETTHNFPLPRQVNAVCQDGSACGLMEIVRMLKERGLAGTFFLNVYEHRSWGDAAMRNVAGNLQAAGQDVALHTHPQWAYDPLRPGMYQYSLDDQTSIIGEGVHLLTAWTGRPVVAHRAGDYAADERTLEALERNGLRIDSSLFWKNPRSRLNGLGLPRNLPASLGGLIEIPVTVYQREERPRLLDGILSPVTSVRKLDADWFLDEAEAISAIDSVVAADLPFLVIFLHSFSFMAGGEDGRVPVTDRHSRDIFRAILERVIEKRLPVVTMRDLASPDSVYEASRGQDPLPTVLVRVGLHRYLWHRLQETVTGALIIGAAVLTFLGVGAVLIAVRLRRPVQHPQVD